MKIVDKIMNTVYKPYRWLVVMFVAWSACCGLRMHAQEPFLKADTVYAKKQGDSLHVHIALSIKPGAIGRNQSLFAVPVLQWRDSLVFQELEGVSFSGNSRYRYDKRNRQLNRMVKDSKGGEPVVRLRADNTSYAYQYAVDWQDWMENASLAIMPILGDCCDSIPLASILLADSLEVTGLERPVVETPPAPADSVWRPAPAVYRNLPALMTAAAELEKKRNYSISMYISYMVGKSDIEPERGNNRAELAKLDSLISSLSDNPLISVNVIRLTGYASIEGAVASNERLSQSRAQRLGDYVQSAYVNHFPEAQYQIRGLGEDWDGLAELVRASDYSPSRKEAILSLFDRYSINNGRENRLMLLEGGAVYRDMKERMFPLLRYTRMEIFFVVQPVTNEMAAKLIDTRPELLSLEEIYRLGADLEKDSRQLIQIYGTAVKTYPDDPVANNNMAVFFLREGDAAGAAPYLQKAGDGTYPAINRAVMHYLLGERETALELLGKVVTSDPSEILIIKKARETLIAE